MWNNAPAICQVSSEDSEKEATNDVKKYIVTSEFGSVPAVRRGPLGVSRDVEKNLQTHTVTAAFGWARPLNQACLMPNPNLAVIRLLLRYGFTPTEELFELVANKGNLEVMQELLKHNPEVFQGEIVAFTLKGVVCKGDVDMAKLVLRCGVDINTAVAVFVENLNGPEICEIMSKAVRDLLEGGENFEMGFLEEKYDELQVKAIRELAAEVCLELNVHHGVHTVWSGRLGISGSRED